MMSCPTCRRDIAGTTISGSTTSAIPCGHIFVIHKLVGGCVEWFGPPGSTETDAVAAFAAACAELKGEWE